MVIQKFRFGPGDLEIDSGDDTRFVIYPIYVQTVFEIDYSTVPARVLPGSLSAFLVAEADATGQDPDKVLKFFSHLPDELEVHCRQSLEDGMLGLVLVAVLSSSNRKTTHGLLLDHLRVYDMVGNAMTVDEAVETDWVGSKFKTMIATLKQDPISHGSIIATIDLEGTISSLTIYE